MNTRNRTSAMVESALITAIAVIFTLVGMYVPFLSMLSIFLPAPFIIIGAKNGLKYSILSLAAASIMVGTLTGPLRALLFIITIGLTAVIMGNMIQRKYSFSLTVLIGSIASIISIIVYMAMMPKLFGFGPLQALEDVFLQAKEMYKGLSGLPGLDPDQLKQMIELVDQGKDFALMALPSFIILSSAITTYINYTFSGAILRKIGFPIEKPKSLSYFKLPDNFMMGLLVISVLTFISNRFNIIKSDALIINLTLLFYQIFTLQGLAVASYFLEKNRLGNMLRRIILVLIYSIPVTNFISSLIGVFETIVNTRKLER